MHKRGPVTAEELIARLAADPEYLAGRRQREIETARKRAEDLAAQAPIRDALRRAGIEAESIWHLTSQSYPAAIPILLEHLQRAYPGDVRESIARALAVPASRAWWKELVRLFREEPLNEPGEGHVKFAIGLALMAAASTEVFDDVVGLLRDRSLGIARLPLLSALTRSRDERRHQILEELASDPDLRIEIAEIQKRRARRTRRAK